MEHTGSSRVRVEIRNDLDERGHPLRDIRVVNSGGEVLAEIYDAHLAGLVAFPQPGVLTLPK